MAKYRVKTAVIEAMLHEVNSEDPMAVYRWIEDNTLGSFEPMACINGSKSYPESGVSIDPRDGRLLVATLGGGVHVNLGDYVIKFDDGRFYPMSADSFHENYELSD